MSVRRLLVCNQAVDADDPVLGFCVGWLRALAARCDHVDVVTMRAGAHDLPANVRVHSLGKELGRSEARRAAELCRVLAGLLHRSRPDACLVHLAPVLAVLAAPALWCRRVPLTVWHTHPAVPPVLAAAARVADTVVTADAGSFRGRARRVVVTGHGIDTTTFSPGPGPKPGAAATILAVGRVAPVKRFELLVDALERLGPGPRARIVGPLGPGDAAYATSLRRRAAEVAPGAVALVGAAPPAAVAQAYRDATVAVSLTAAGSFDKAALEAMACGVPLVTTNPALATVDPALLAPTDDAAGVASALAAVLARTAEDRRALGGRLRDHVVANHSLERLADLLVDEVLPRPASAGARW